ncbi:MAG: MoaD/ThiS family protein [Hyphomicrobium sp.]
MPAVRFTPNLLRHIGDANGHAPGRTVREVLDAHFTTHPQARSYVLDDQGALRKHMNIAVSGAPLRDRVTLSDPVADDGTIHVLQALSGG